MRAWLRHLDEDAFSGALWRRPVFLVPLCVLAVVLVGATLGFAGGAVFAAVQPTSSVRPGPDGAPITVSNDYTAIPFVTGLGGAALGLLCGGLLLAAVRWRRRAGSGGYR